MSSDGRHDARDLAAWREQGLRFSMSCLAVNVGLAAVKIAVGLLTGSHALLAGALYSINDVLSAGAVAVSLKVATRPANHHYPYGHGKAEFIAVGIVSITLAGGVLVVLGYSMLEPVGPGTAATHLLAIGVALVCLLANEVLARRGTTLAERLDSPALLTSAEHNHADAISSIAVLVGVGAAMVGHPEIDKLVAVFEAAHIVALSGILLAKSLKGLMDTALPEEDIELVERACARVPGVTGVAHVRSRRAGSEVWIAAELVVSPRLSVREAHELTARATRAIRHVLGPSVQTQVRFRAAVAPTLTSGEANA